MDHSYCAMVSKEKKKHKYCHVPQCKTKLVWCKLIHRLFKTTLFLSESFLTNFCIRQYEKDVTFHSFPKSAVLRKKWEYALKMNSQTPAKTITVCCKHFTKYDFLQFKKSNEFENKIIDLKYFKNVEI